MARIEKLTCSSCGASLEADMDTQLIECRFCGTRLLLEKKEPAQIATEIFSKKHAAEVKLWFEKLGIDNFISSPETETVLDLHGRTIDSPDLRYLEYFPNIVFLNMEDTNLDDEAAPYLKKLVNLEYIIINNTAITSLAFAGSMPKLETIRASGTSISDTGLIDIQNITGLKTLDLNNTQVTDAGMEYMKNLRGLENLDVEGTLVTIEGLKLISGLPALKKINYPKSIRDTEFFRNGMLHMLTVKSVVNLSCAGITDTDLKTLERVTTIEMLDLRSNKITDSGLASLKGNIHLNYLDLSHNKITDAGIESLAGFKRLANLDLSGNRVTDKGLKRLKALLPKVKVTS